MSARLACALLLTLAAAGCAREISANRPDGPVGFRDASGVLGRSVRVDFGELLLGARSAVSLKIENDGATGLLIDRVVRTERFDESFGVPNGSIPLPPGATAVEVSFAPELEGTHSADLELQLVLDGQVSWLDVHLEGVGVTPHCAITPGDVLDFGTTRIGREQTRMVTVTNSAALPISFSVGALAEGTVFDVPPLKQDLIGAHSSVSIPVTFRPRVSGRAQEFLRLRAPPSCGAGVIVLSGAAVEQALTLAPAIDFGFVNLGTRAKRELKITNQTVEDFAIRKVAISPSTLGFATAALPTPLVVPAGESVRLGLEFLPTLIGSTKATLSLTEDDLLPRHEVVLTGFGGGPDIDVVPLQVDFGKVAVGGSQHRTVVISNVGTDVPGTTLDNLFLGPQRPFLKDATRSFGLASSASFPASGLAAGESTPLSILFEPKQPGVITGTVTIFSNDPDEPERVVTLTAEGALMPPCSYEALPGKLDFGDLEPGQSLTLRLRIRNLSNAAGEECRIQRVAAGFGTSPDFTFPSAPAVLLPGENLDVPVRFTASGVVGARAGTIEISTSSTSQPEVTIALSAQVVAQSCLVVSPREIDFGATLVGCGTASRKVRITNVCSSAVSVVSSQLSGGSFEFALQQSPTLPLTVGPGASLELSIAFRPVDEGPEFSSVEIVSLGSPGCRVVASLRGRGALVPRQTDTFRQAPGNKVDLLLLVDDSCSMQDEQQVLGNNFASLVASAAGGAADYRIAVLTTTVCTTNVCVGQRQSGRLVLGSVIEPTTPNGSAAFAQLTNVGTTANLFDQLIRPAFLALSRPLIATNVGFLRDDASLAVITISDHTDQDLLAVDFYYRFFLDLKGGRGKEDRFTFSGFVPIATPGPGSCTPGVNGATPGFDRVPSMVAKSDGVLEDVCSLTTSTALQGVGRRTFTPRARFFLTSTPDLVASPISVTAGGVAIPEKTPGGATNWRYLPASDLLEFDPLAIPTPGTTIEISYLVKC